MKRKGVTITLLLVVASIWGAILIKVVNPPTAEPSKAMVNLPSGPEWKQVAVEHPPSDSLGNYRDPFLGSTSVVPRSGAVPMSAARKVQSTTQTTAHKTAASWPKITFQGLLRNRTNSRSVALLTIEGKNAMLMQGAKDACGVSVVAVYTDSVVLAMDGESRCFRR